MFGARHKTNAIMETTLSAVCISMSVSCASQVQVISNPPGATVYAIQADGTSREIGKTPMTIDPTTLKSPITLQRKGYDRSIVSLPSSAGYELSVSVDLQQSQVAANLDEMLLSENSAVLDKMLMDFFSLQQALRSSKTNSFENLKTRLEPRYRNVSMFHVLSGHFYVIRRETDNARRSYLRALEINPSNAEARRALNNLGAKGGEP